MIKFDDETPAKSNSNFKRSDALRPKDRKMYIRYPVHPHANDRGHWHEDELDTEYTFYGLLALGHLSV